MQFDESKPDSIQPILSVTEFIEYINLIIGRKKVIVEGEIGSFNVSQGKWVFFDLKDKESKVGCFTMLYTLESQLADGMQIRVTGTPRMYGKMGKFSIYVDKIELQGAGALKKAFELTKAKLEKEGIFDVSRKRPLKQIPQRIGLICSRESAAYTDFMRIINQRWGGLEIYLAHVQVQGERSINEIVGAFEYFNSGQTEVDTIVLIRGGGSLEDLQAFNSEAVARAVFGSKIPVVCGVGHERDESLADYAADVRAATPTHAAGLVVPDREEMERAVLRSEARLIQMIEHTLEWHRHKIDSSLTILIHSINDKVKRFAYLIKTLLVYVQQKETGLREVRIKVNVLQENTNHLFTRYLQESHTSVVALERNLSNMSPLAVVQRGYSIVRKKGRVIKNITTLSAGDEIDITLSDGELVARVLAPQGQGELF